MEQGLRKTCWVQEKLPKVREAYWWIFLKSRSLKQKYWKENKKKLDAKTTSGWALKERERGAEKCGGGDSACTSNSMNTNLKRSYLSKHRWVSLGYLLMPHMWHWSTIVTGHSICLIQIPWVSIEKLPMEKIRSFMMCYIRKIRHWPHANVPSFHLLFCHSILIRPHEDNHMDQMHFRESYFF